MKTRLLIIIGMIGLSLLIPQVWGVYSEEEFDMKDYDETFTIIENPMKYVMAYKITNAVINEVNLNCDSASLALSIKSNDTGILQLDIPQSMFGGIFMVLVDEAEWDDVSIIKNILTVNFPENTSRIEILGSYYLSPDKYTGVCDIIHDPPHSYILPPLKQSKLGMEPFKVVCNDGLNLLLKPTEFTKPACVTDETFEKLSHRGWAVMASDDYQDW
ncbi:MAG: hypothetical protein IIC67_11230 [Thaumarchaeota archaeon]|nr:hypothetical protein [Nitrososphaerota archaeon]